MNANLKQVADNTTHLNSEERTQLLRIHKDFEDLFDSTLGYWGTELVNLDINPYFKPFNCKYYLFPIINKETFRKEPKLLVKVGALTLVQYIQCSILLFIIPKKEVTVRFITYYCRLNHKSVKNPYPLPRIGGTMKQLEIFQY